ncbi:high mobility group protein 20A-like [Pollicipes pollicipes]|uniref:high mobility group protein 20A-like n=1 Tax=Pollicipes pollicipes TaxID=41117 RepID=UPI001884AE3F|nr:high mobility group protein 20A-like [Pollicipes pollicipes]
MSEPGPSDKQGRKKGWPRGKKRTLKIKDVNAPKLPMSGYMLFLNDHREQVRAANPGATFSDMTRLLANAWQAAPQEEKQQYMEAAQQQKERYSRELIKYQQTDAYRAFSEQVKAKGGSVVVSGSGGGGGGSSRAARHDKENEKEARAPPPPAPDQDTAVLEIPIFTETFLTHNREREAELRQLRRANTEFEEQNATLQKHIDNMKEAVERLESETEQQRGQNSALQQHLDQLRALLSERFAAVPLPGCPEPLTPDTVDVYLAKLHALILERPQENQALVATVRDIVHRLEHQ